MINTIIFIAVWIVCGILAYGITFADFSFESLGYEKLFKRTDIKISVFFGLLGPIGLIAILSFTNFAEHGIKFK